MKWYFQLFFFTRVHVYCPSVKLKNCSVDSPRASITDSGELPVAVASILDKFPLQLVATCPHLADSLTSALPTAFLSSVSPVLWNHFVPYWWFFLSLCVSSGCKAPHVHHHRWRGSGWVWRYSHDLVLQTSAQLSVAFVLLAYNP